MGKQEEYSSREGSGEMQTGESSVRQRGLKPGKEITMYSAVRKGKDQEQILGFRRKQSKRIW